MYIDLNRIEFVITNACSGKYKHCSAGEHISSDGVVDADAAVIAEKRLAERFKIKSVMVHLAMHWQLEVEQVHGQLHMAAR